MSSPAPILLSTAYLPPLQYISKFITGRPVFLEGHENYQKQSYRNRCYIYGANGKQCLVIPVVKNQGIKTPIQQVAIDYSPSWQRIHWKSIESAYRASPFFEYYADDLAAAFTRKTRLLFDWNLDLLKIVLQLLGIPHDLKITVDWQKNPPPDHDYRQRIHPKTRLAKTDAGFVPVPYQQVFQERSGFLPNLSIIDLLLNEGPEAVQLLRRMIKRNL